MLSNDQVEKWGEEYRRLRYALPEGTTFQAFLLAPTRYRSFAENRLRDWKDNPRVLSIASHHHLILN